MSESGKMAGEREGFPAPDLTLTDVSELNTHDLGIAQFSPLQAEGI